MQKLTASQKGWTAIVIALWVIALAALIFVMPSSSAASGQKSLGEAEASGSLATTLAEMEPPAHDAIAAEIIDLRYVYGQEMQGFVPVCNNEPEQLVDMKLQAAGDLADQIKLDGSNNYILLFNDSSETAVAVDAIPANVMDLCGDNYFQEIFSTEQGFPVHYDGGMWRFGPRIQ
ncbi:hypothetical protein QP994_04080 [Corynebacterium sp. MSK044]|uniref:hypothetical protein n=1 Tax=Corynebacterium sp. MSK044 TaxID=3050195 RepID=UPI00254CB99B|nr:hypothetical protein [Corynebacterium sp. MSK044]MDK8797063.1 hypothetical protein [Corynebacterium sp. MSK044]